MSFGHSSFDRPLSPSASARAPHVCASSDCGCGLTRRDVLRLSALAGAGAAGLLKAGDAAAQSFKGDDQPVKIGYLPITDATPLLVAHARKLFEAEGLRVDKPRLFRTWAQIVEAFVAGQVNVIHLLSPATLWVRYGTRFPAKVVAWNHVNGSALTVAPGINSVAELGGRTLAIPFWYSIHNVLLQQILQANGLVPVTRARRRTSAATRSTWWCCRRPRWCRRWRARRLPASSSPSPSTRRPRQPGSARCCASPATSERTTPAA